MNLLTSSLSTSSSVPSSLFWAHGGMETDATISDETDKSAENVKVTEVIHILRNFLHKPLTFGVIEFPSVLL